MAIDARPLLTSIYHNPILPFCSCDVKIADRPASLGRHHGKGHVTFYIRFGQPEGEEWFLDRKCLGINGFVLKSLVVLVSIPGIPRDLEKVY